MRTAELLATFKAVKRDYPECSKEWLFLITARRFSAANDFNFATPESVKKELRGYKL